MLAPNWEVLTLGWRLLGLLKQDPLSVLLCPQHPGPGAPAPPGIQATAANPAPCSDRQMGMGFASVNARLGGLAAPLLTMLGEFSAVLPPVGFGAPSILAGLAVCFLAETRDVPLVETIEAMERR